MTSQGPPRMPERSGRGEAADDIAVWIDQTRHTAARLRLFAPEIAATLASVADDVEASLAQLPPVPGLM